MLNNQFSDNMSYLLYKDLAIPLLFNHYIVIKKPLNNFLSSGYLREFPILLINGKLDKYI